MNKLALEQEPKRAIDSRAGNSRISPLDHLAKVHEGKWFLSIGNRFENGAATGKISGETFKLRQHATP